MLTQTARIWRVSLQSIASSMNYPSWILELTLYKSILTSAYPKNARYERLTIIDIISTVTKIISYKECELASKESKTSTHETEQTT